MTKTYNNLYPDIYDFHNIYNAYIKAQKGKRYKNEVLKFKMNLEGNIIEIQNELIYKTFESGRYREFKIYEPKERIIMALPFKDRVVHHALCNVIEPIFENRFIYDSYACRPGKGTHAAADRTTEFLRITTNKWDKVYCLKSDVKKYFYNIDHNILKRIIRKKIVCSDTLWLVDKIIDSTAEAGEINPVGIPIGNLTSQLFANVYLNELDYFIKHDLRAKYYIRYMDDFIILHHDKRLLWYFLQEIRDFLDRKLNLELNGKTSVFPINQGINFVGYRIWPTHRLLRKSSIKRIKRGLKKLQKDFNDGKIPLKKVEATIMSWLGHCKHADTYRIRKKVLGEIE
ncbi:MAG: RNA-directed polymerase [Halanaerobiales bacterium]|nr:RNA-directed polymerase [Halanaerobiales bacterium]